MVGVVQACAGDCLFTLSQKIVPEPHIGCGQCHLLPPEFGGEKMSCTILFDLDDTLIENDIDRFLPGYLKALANHMSPWVPPETLD